MYRIFVIAVMGLALTQTHCATILGPSSDSVKIESEPSGASVYFRGSMLGKTPTTVEIPRQLEAAYLEFRLDGYQTKTIQLQKSIEGTAFINIAFITTTSGATSWGIDSLSGKLFKYASRSYVVSLEKKTASSNDLEREEVLAYVLKNSSAIQKSIARNDWQWTMDLCTLADFKNCAQLKARAIDRSTELLAAPHGLALLRILKKST